MARKTFKKKNYEGERAIPGFNTYYESLLLLLYWFFSSCLQSFPTLGSSRLSQFFASGGQNIGVSALVSVLPMNIQDWLVWSPCSSRDFQESSPTPQFKSINCLALSFLWWTGRPGMLQFMGPQRVGHNWETELNSFLYSPNLTSIHDYWKNHSFDETDLCWQSNVSAF